MGEGSGFSGHEQGYGIDNPIPDILPVYVDVEPRYGLDAVVFPPSYDSYGTALGAYEDDTNDRRSRRCFNCGSLDHAVSECPTPRNPGLISLSRQYYEFYKDDNGLSSHRLHEVEDWRRQRIEWLETFEPGQVKGELLRDALGLQEGDTGEHVEWLRNMAVWGYPKGWVGSVDPRLRVWKRIMREDDDADAQSEVPEEITIFGEEGEEEDVLLPPDTLMRPNFSSFDEGEASSSTLSDNHSLSEDCAIEDESSRSPTHRWVTYPDTYFSSSRLPIYNGLSLPPIGVSMPFPPRPNFPYPLPGVPRLQPYERPSSWHVHGRFVPPPPLPPPSSPPPLPPDLRSHGSRDDPIYILDDSDMEFSDSE
ncbi:unnamed protein product [Somion occarium]|uniref:CCHC-type domain-containing protein n=1 Tax=Somion occarium TaxID=3059160 RepID=A0ABP1DGI2_9APHY